MRIGVCGDETSSIIMPLKPQFLSYVGSVPAIDNPNSGFFPSVISLSGLKKVDLCYVGNRGSGILIYYIKGPIVALGQRYTAQASKHCCIHDRNGSSISRICFTVNKPGVLAFVTNCARPWNSSV